MGCLITVSFLLHHSELTHSSLIQYAIWPQRFIFMGLYFALSKCKICLMFSCWLLSDTLSNPRQYTSTPSSRPWMLASPSRNETSRTRPTLTPVGHRSFSRCTRAPTPLRRSIFRGRRQTPYSSRRRLRPRQRDDTNRVRLWSITRWFHLELGYDRDDEGRSTIDDNGDDI